jgi:hypothetical protein
MYGVRLRRRLGALMAGTLIAFGAAAVTSTPAQASTGDCAYSAGHNEVAGNHITSYRGIYCLEGENTFLPTWIERYLSPGVWQTVASGTGTATYYCAGSAYNVYRANGGTQFAILCT